MPVPTIDDIVNAECKMVLFNMNTKHVSNQLNKNKFRKVNLNVKSSGHKKGL